MTTVDKEITSALHDALIQQVGVERHRLWFGANTRLSLSDRVLVVEAATPFFQDWLRTNFRSALEQAAATVVGAPVEVGFRVNPELCEAEESAEAPARISDGDKAGPHAATAKSSPAGNCAGARSVPMPQSRRSYADFDSFVVGHPNRVAHASACMVTERPGCLSPLYLYGDTGVGKTHLLEGIWTSILAVRPGCRALFLPAEQFTTLFLEALHHSGLPSFRRKYRSVELLILDDVQFFAGKKATTNELLHTIQSLLRHDRQIILAADRPPAELMGLGPELVSRLCGGMVCQMEMPDHPTRVEIVRRYVERHQFDITANIQQLVATRLSDNTRELFGALNRLHATSQAIGEPLTVSMAEESLSDLILSSGRPVQLPDIEKAVCDVFGLQPESLRSGRKVKSVSHPRMLAMWLARKHTRSALSEIGDYFGRRSHATVISANKRVNGWMTSGDHLQLANHTCHVEDAIRRVEKRMRTA